MNSLGQDLRYGWRTLQRNPGFALVAILTLAVGIGANAVMFSVIEGVLLHRLPFADPDRVVLIWDTDANRGIDRGVASPAEFLDWREQNHVFEQLSAFRTIFFTTLGKSGPEQILAGQCSGNFFRLLGVKPALGRDFVQADEQPGQGQVTVINYGFWQRQYGGDPGVIGRSIALNGKPYTVIGVLAKDFTVYGYGPEYEAWVPLTLDRAQLNRDDHEIIVFGRLRKEVSLSQAQAEMETIIARLKLQYPAFDQKNGVRVIRFQDDIVRTLRPALLILLAAVVAVLLIACANVANLMLARAVSREREIAIRSALGAGRGRIVRQLLTESMLLALIGGAFGIIVALGGLNLLHTLLPPSGTHNEIPYSSFIGIDAKFLIFTVAISLASGILFGLAPAMQISRSGLFESLKEGGRGSTAGRQTHFVRSALIVSEIALSLMLLMGAGLLVRSFVRMATENIGFDPSHLLTMQVWLPESRYPAGSGVVNFYQQLVDRETALPGVKSASAVDFLPLSGWVGVGFCNFDIAGRARPASGEEFTSLYAVVDWRYLRTIGLPLQEGRDFQESDGPNNGAVALVNEALAHRYWPNSDPVGQRIHLLFPAVSSPWDPQPTDSWLTIVGVTGNIQDWSWTNSKEGQLYLLNSQNPSRLMRLVMRVNGDPAAITSAARLVMQSVDPNQPVTEIHTMAELFDQTMSLRRLSMFLLAVFAGVATLLAAVGIYGVMAHVVTQRSHEIGIRMALGADSRNVMRMIVGDGMRLAAIGLLLGLLGSLAGMQLVASQLYGVKASDPATFLGVALLLTAVAVAACYFPARRATTVDPLIALRHE